MYNVKFVKQKMKKFQTNVCFKRQVSFSTYIFLVSFFTKFTAEFLYDGSLCCCCEKFIFFASFKALFCVMLMSLT